MKAVRLFVAVAVVAFVAPAARAQEFPKPGPEHEILKKLEGKWDTTMKVAGMESKGSVTYKMELGGLWLVSSFESDFGGMKFTGKGLDSYDATKKKYIAVWVDSMLTYPLILEGTYDKEKKTMTMTGEGRGMDGKPAKWRSVSTMTSDDSFEFQMFLNDDKEPMFTILYKRQK